MMDSNSKCPPQTFVTRGWRVDPSRNLLQRGEDKIRVEPRVMDALVYLAERSGHVVSKDDLIDVVWHGRSVTDDVLTVTICALRKALGDDARRPEYVETVPRRGYRWIAPVSRLEIAGMPWTPSVQGETALATTPSRVRSISRLAALGIVLGAVFTAVWVVVGLTNQRHVSPSEAHEAYVKGRFFLDQRSTNGWRQALEQFERAITLDPLDPSAQAGLADTYSAMSDLGVATPAEIRPRAFQSARRAIELDRSSAEGYEALGRAQFLFDWDFPAAEHNLRCALTLNPDYMPTQQAMAWLESAQGKHTEAVASARRALQLDPVNTARYTELAWVLTLAGSYEEALHEIDRALDLSPRSFEAYLMKGWTSDLAGDSAAAFHAYYDGLRMVAAPEETLKRIEAIYQRDGLPGYYRSWLDAQRRGGKMPMSSTWRAQLYIHAGQRDDALHALEEAYQKHEGALAWVNVEPSFRSLHSEPRFRVIAVQVGRGLLDTR